MLLWRPVSHSSVSLKPFSIILLFISSRLLNVKQHHRRRVSFGSLELKACNLSSNLVFLLIPPTIQTHKNGKCVWILFFPDSAISCEAAVPKPALHGVITENHTILITCYFLTKKPTRAGCALGGAAGCGVSVPCDERVCIRKVNTWSHLCPQLEQIPAAQPGTASLSHLLCLSLAQKVISYSNYFSLRPVRLGKIKLILPLFSKGGGCLKEAVWNQFLWLCTKHRFPSCYCKLN